MWEKWAAERSWVNFDLFFVVIIRRWERIAALSTLSRSLQCCVAQWQKNAFLPSVKSEFSWWQTINCCTCTEIKILMTIKDTQLFQLERLLSVNLRICQLQTAKTNRGNLKIKWTQTPSFLPTSSSSCQKRRTRVKISSFCTKLFWFGFALFIKYSVSSHSFPFRCVSSLS